jgi:hypothetical protein
MHRLLHEWRVLAVGCEGIRNINSLVEDSNDKYINFNLNRNCDENFGFDYFKLR